MTVELTSLKIGKTCKPEKIFKNICNPSQMT